MPPQRRTAALGEEVETIIERGSELLHSERRGAGSRQFKGERDTVEPSADGRYRRGSALVRREAGIRRLHPCDEQRRCAGSQHVLQRVHFLCRHGERRHPIEALAFRSERLAACRDYVRCPVGA